MQSLTRFAVLLYVGIVQGRFIVTCAATLVIVQPQYAQKTKCVAVPPTQRYVLNMLHYDSDSIAYFFIVLTPCKWIVFTVMQ